jgi:hypothetical protein
MPYFCFSRLLAGFLDKKSTLDAILTLIRAAIYIDVVVRLEVIYDLQATNRREGGDTSWRGCSRQAPDLHLERARDRAGSSRTAWRAYYWRG